MCPLSDGSIKQDMEMPAICSEVMNEPWNMCTRCLVPLKIGAFAPNRKSATTLQTMSNSAWDTAPRLLTITARAVHDFVSSSFVCKATSMRVQTEEMTSFVRFDLALWGMICFSAPGSPWMPMPSSTGQTKYKGALCQEYKEEGRVSTADTRTAL